MDKLSIQSLTGKQSLSHNKLSIQTLSNIKHDASEINTNLILKSIKMRRDKKLEIYMRHVSICFEQMNVLNNQNKTDMIYVVPLECHEIIDYNSKECCEYLEKKLNEKFIDVFIMTKNSIFITWKYIEQNKDKKNNN